LIVPILSVDIAMIYLLRSQCVVLRIKPWSLAMGTCGKIMMIFMIHSVNTMRVREKAILANGFHVHKLVFVWQCQLKIRMICCMLMADEITRAKHRNQTKLRNHRKRQRLNQVKHPKSDQAKLRNRARHRSQLRSQMFH